jgi:hypothetical protein
VSVLLGDKRRFAVEVGDRVGAELRQVDLWAAGQWLTCDDNEAFVKQFRRSVRDTAIDVRAGHGSSVPFTGLSPAAAHRRFVAAYGNEDELLRERFWFFHWGPTTDNVTAFLFREGDELVLTFQFRREEHLREHPEHAGAVFVVEIQAAEFADILDALVAILDRDQGP